VSTACGISPRLSFNIRSLRILDELLRLTKVLLCGTLRAPLYNSRLSSPTRWARPHGCWTGKEGLSFPHLIALRGRFSPRVPHEVLLGLLCTGSRSQPLGSWVGSPNGVFPTLRTCDLSSLPFTLLQQGLGRLSL
jgi:hypothetical protein